MALHNDTQGDRKSVPPFKYVAGPTDLEDKPAVPLYRWSRGLEGGESRFPLLRGAKRPSKGRGVWGHVPPEYIFENIFLNSVLQWVLGK